MEKQYLTFGNTPKGRFTKREDLPNPQVTEVMKTLIASQLNEREAAQKVEAEALKTQLTGLSDEVKLLAQRAASLPASEVLEQITALSERAAKVDFDKLNELATEWTERKAKEINEEAKNITLDALALRAAEEVKDNQLFKDFVNRAGGVNSLSLRAAAPITTAAIASTTLANIVNLGIVKAKDRKMQVFNYFRGADTTVAKYTYAEMEGKDGATAIVAEGEVKPLLDVKFTAGDAEYDTIAGINVFSEKILRDAPAVLREVIAYTMQDAYKKLEAATIYGGTEITGVVEGASAFNLTTITDVNASPQLTDVVRVLMEQVRAVNGNPDTLLIPDALLAKGELARDANGRLLDEKVSTMYPELNILTFVPTAGNEDKLAVLDSSYFHTLLRKPVNGTDPTFDIVIERQKDDLEKNQLTARTEIFAFGYHPALANAYCVYDAVETVKAAIITGD